MKREWIKRFSHILINEGLDISWQLPSGTRSEALDAEVTGLLYKSGCRYANYAPESGSERTLKRIKKKIKKSSMLASMRAGVRNGLNIKANMIFGFPDEELGDIAQNYKFIARWDRGHQRHLLFPLRPIRAGIVRTSRRNRSPLTTSIL